MILLLEPISKKIDMYVPAYPLPILEIASFVKANAPSVDIKVISIPVDYGLPLTKGGKKRIYQELLESISMMKPKGIGISCTAISQAGEVIVLSELIKEQDPRIFIFSGGYFPSIYYKEIFSKTDAIDLVVIGEGEVPSLKVIQLLEKDQNPLQEDIPNLAWRQKGRIHLTEQGKRFDLKQKAQLRLDLLKNPKSYDILPYAFSRGCPYHCHFCMEEFVRPIRKEVPASIIHEDLTQLSRQSNAHTLLVSDALFRSFELFPFFQSLDLKVHFETRGDVLDPKRIAPIAKDVGMIAIGFESASYRTLRRMNKVKDRAHYQHYISNTRSIFRAAVENDIPLMVFMIAGYPGDTEEDLEKTFSFASELSKDSGVGGHVFKIGECHAYPRTKTYELTSSLSDVIFDDDGVFGQNVVRQPSKNLNFESVLEYSKNIFNLSHFTPKLQSTILDIMPFFRIPAQAFEDNIIPDLCFSGSDRAVFNVKRDNLLAFKEIVPSLNKKYEELLPGERVTRHLPL